MNVLPACDCGEYAVCLLAAVKDVYILKVGGIFNVNLGMVLFNFVPNAVVDGGISPLDHQQRFPVQVRDMQKLF